MSTVEAVNKTNSVNGTGAPDGAASAAISPFMTNFGRVLGAVGMVLLCSAPLTWLLTGHVGPLVLGKIVGGGLCVGIYLATNAGFFGRVAGARSTGLMVMSGLTVIIVVGLVGMANYVVLKNPKEIDLTREGLHTLSDQTLGVLGRLQSGVKIQAFFASYEPLYPQVEETLRRYESHSSQLAYELVDPQSRPDLVEQYDITERGPRIVVTSGDNEARAKDISEQELTHAVIRVAEQTQKTVFYLTGHGEGDASDVENAEGYKALYDAIRAEGYQVEALSLIKPITPALMGTKVSLKDEVASESDADQQAGADHDDAGKLEVPTRAALLIIAGPKNVLLPPEVDAIEDYLDRGGRLLALLDPEVDSGLAGLLRQWKIDARSDIVVDTNPLNRLLGLGPAAPMVQPTDVDHAITRDLTAPAILVTTRSLAVVSGGEAGVDAQAIVGVGETAWGETSLDSEDGTAERDESDNLGPIDVAVVATRATAGVAADKISDEARVVAFGDSDWVSNKYLTMQGNTDLVLNTVNWMAEQEEKISIRPKQRQASQLYLSNAQLGQLKFFSMDILPVIIVAFGLSIVLIRRQR